MLFPNHPRPVRRSREVAETTVRQAQREAVLPGHVLQVAHDAPEAAAPVARDVAEAGARAVGDRVEFDVGYRLGEYLEVVAEFARRELSQIAQAKGKPSIEALSWPTRAMIAACAAPMFAFKKWRMPLCSFTIDDAGVERRTRQGTVRVAWDRIEAVDRYGNGYLIRLAQGAMPLPLGCLDAAQRDAFERLVARHLADRPPVA